MNWEESLVWSRTVIPYTMGGVNESPLFSDKSVQINTSGHATVTVAPMDLAIGISGRAV